ncbi:hypothetical protein X737_12450 [Mesorhizobium sp. L48C026A00]|nr:hypothetical protein X737_12450 [Mesorhizobium sp. L48C026A00]
MRLEIGAQPSDIIVDPGTVCRRPEPMRKWKRFPPRRMDA